MDFVEEEEENVEALEEQSVSGENAIRSDVDVEEVSAETTITPGEVQSSNDVMAVKEEDRTLSDVDSVKEEVEVEGNIVEEEGNIVEEEDLSGDNIVEEEEEEDMDVTNVVGEDNVVLEEEDMGESQVLVEEEEDLSKSNVIDEGEEEEMKEASSRVEEEGFVEGYVADEDYEAIDWEEMLEERAKKQVVSDHIGLDDVVEEDEEEEEAKDEQAKRQMETPSGFFLDTWEEVQEESEASLTLVETPLDRQPLIDAYLHMMNDYAFIKRQNNFLHKKMCEYFLKRKMEHVLHEVTDHYDEAASKYYKRLDNFSDLIEEDREKREVISAEVQRLKAVRNVQMSKAKKHFREMIAREKEIGTGLISAKTGKEIPEKVLEKMINNQSNKAKELEQLRLSHIKIRNATVEKHAAIRSLDKIGDSYTLVEYEQLKIENQGHADKIEEKDEELSRLRRRCADAIQCLGHIKEKCAAVEHNIRIMRETLEEKEAERTVVRENLIQLKQQRDYYRQETQRLREENGLMTKDKMLVDMESSMKECDQLHEKIAHMERVYEKKKEKLDAIKVNYEKEKRKKVVEERGRISPPSLDRKDSVRQYLRRPTIMYPRFEAGAFEFT